MSPQVSAVRRALLSSGSVGSDESAPSFSPEHLVELVAVVRFVSDHAVWMFVKNAVVKDRFDELDLVRGSAAHAKDESKTVAAWGCQDFGLFPALRLADEAEALIF